jgi:HSP20 family protein
MAHALVKSRKPFDLLVNWENYIKTVHEHFTGESEKIWAPAVDIEEKDGKFLIKADLPGVSRKDIYVEFKDGNLSIRGTRNNKHEKKVFLLERYSGEFERIINLPEGIKKSDIKADYKDGILELTIPMPDGQKLV